MRNTTHELARGNLDIRASENLGNRQTKSVRDFNTMAGELRNQIQSERNLLSGVSHELRSPIARPWRWRWRAMHTMRRCPVSNRTPSNSIPCWSASDVARLESGQQKPKFEPLLLNDVVDEVLHDANPKLLRLELRLPIAPARKSR